MPEQLAFGELPLFQWPPSSVISTKSGWRPLLQCVLVQTEEQLADMRRQLVALRDIVYDSETSGLNTHLGARIVGHAFAAVTAPNVVTAWYVPVRHIGGDNEAQQQLSPETVAEFVRDIMTASGRCGFYNAKFDLAMLRADGVRVARDCEDASISANIDNENEHTYQLKALAAKYCIGSARGEEKTLEDWMRSDARKLGIPFRKRRRADGLDTVEQPAYLDRFGYARSPIQLCGAYACKDVFYTLYLWLVKYRHTREQWPDLWTREHSVARKLHKMEWAGLPADGALIRDSHDRARAEVDYWLAECQRLGGGSKFTGTDGQLRKLFFDKLGMRPPRYTKKKLPSVDKIARNILMRQFPEHAQLLYATLKYSRAQKLYGTYTGSFLRFLSPEGRIHASYNQLERKDRGVPVTGRLNSSDPNMQNVDSRPLHMHTCGCGDCVEEAAKYGYTRAPGPEVVIEVHRYFTVPEGFIRFYIDFSQIELRVLTWLCQDPVLLHAYQSGVDIHQLIAEQLGIPRKIAKQVNFGNSYGMTKVGLAVRLPGYYDDPDGIEALAERVLESYFQKYTRIRQFRAYYAKQMRRNGCQFVSPFGRPRRIPTIRSPQRWERERAERMMMSSIVSGTAADIMKESMIRCDDILVARDDGSELVQTIHDELVFDTPLVPGWADLLIQLVAAMEDWRQFSHPDDRQGVPIRVNAAVTTTTWADKREVGICDGKLSWAA